MSELRFDAINVGDEISAYTTPGISRTTLALYAGASGDHNPMHIDIDFAKKAGMPDVFAQGMLIMALLGRVLINSVAQTAVRSYSARFGAMTQVHDKLTCKAKVVEKFEDAGEKRVRLEMSATNQDGEIKLIGEAVVALP